LDHLVSDQFFTSPTLLKRLANREDQEAWTRFVEMYGPMITRFLSRRESDLLEIEEIVQRVCIRILDAIPGFHYDPARGRFRSYLGTITAREYIRRQKERKPTTDLDFNTVGPTLEAEWEDESKSHLFDLAVKRVQAEVTAEVWYAFHQQWFNQRDVELLAQEMNRNASWLYQAKSKTLARLREEVDRLANDEGVFLRGG